MSSPARTYTIIPYPLADPSVWDVVIELEESCRTNLAGDEVVLKWEGTVPSILSRSTVYNHPDILAIMHTPAWSPEEEP